MNYTVLQKKSSKISVRIAGLFERSIPFIHPCRGTMFTRVCSPTNKTGTPKTSVFKDIDYTSHAVLPLLAQAKYHGGVSHAAKSS